MEQFLKFANPQSNEVEIRFKNVNKLKSSYVGFKLDNSGKYTKSVSENIVYIGTRKQTSHHSLPKDIRYVKGDPSYFQVKTSLKKPVFEENFKLSESKEENVENFTENIFNNHYEVQLVRVRKRTSFRAKDKSHLYDISEVIEKNLVNNSSSIKYEVEVELFNTDLKFVRDLIKTTVDLLQYDFSGHMSDYNSKIGSPNKFGGPLPLTLTKDKFESGALSCGYTVTDKADGMRYHLYISNDRSCFFVDRNREMSYHGVSSKIKNCIFDGELVNNTFYIFDALYINGKDVRDLVLEERLMKAGDIVGNSSSRMASVKKTPSFKVKLKMKTFYFKDASSVYKIQCGIKVLHRNAQMSLGEICENIWNNRSNTFTYELDGLIFTPMLKSYYNNEIYKWKPYDTIDFLIKKGSNQFNLHIAGFSHGRYTNLPFSGVDNNGTFVLKRGRNEERIPNKIFTDTTLSQRLRYGIIDPSSKDFKTYVDNSVVEFKYNRNKQTFIPLKARDDKTHANGIQAVNDAWVSMKTPLSLKDIRKTYYKSCLRPFHNMIKDFLIKKYMSNKSVLDIGFGAGGDIHKYSKHSVKSVTGIDIVPTKYTLPRFIKTLVLQGDTYNVKNELTKARLPLVYDVVNCQFAAHYFFRNEQTLMNFVNNVKNSLKADGFFVMTVLDGKKVLKLMKDDNEKIRKCNDDVVYSIKTPSKQINTIGQKIEVKLGGTSYFEEVSKEYLVNIQLFIKIMKKENFDLVNATSFKQFEKRFNHHVKIMCDAEKEYSFMNTVLVFKKGN